MNQAVVSTTHPSYQANSYQSLLTSFNEEVYNSNIYPTSCAYLHNYERKNPEPLLAPQYAEIIEETPIFFRDEAEKLQNFIKKYVGKGQWITIDEKQVIETDKIATILKKKQTKEERQDNFFIEISKDISKNGYRSIKVSTFLKHFEYLLLVYL